MAKSKVKKHGSGKRPTPHMDKLALRQSLTDKLTREETDELEREIRASLKKGISEAVERAEHQAYLRHWAVTIRVLRDRYAWEKDDIIDLWNQCVEYLEDISTGLITPEEMLRVLEREDGITISMNEKKTN